MATVKEIEISRNWGVRDNSVFDMIWDVRVEEDESYDLVKFLINELNKNYYWIKSIGVKCGTTEEEIREIVEDYASSITDKDIKEYEDFLADGEKWGWD